MPGTRNIFWYIGSLTRSYKHRQEISFINHNISKSNKMIHLFPMYFVVAREQIDIKWLEKVDRVWWLPIGNDINS